MSDLAALLASGQVKEVLLLSNPDSELGKKVLVAARERLRLSKVLCEICEGTRYYKGPSEMCGCWMGEDSTSIGSPCQRHACPSCGGSGGVWPAELVQRLKEVAYTEQWNQRWIEAWLDAVESWMKAGKGSDDV